MATPPLQEGGTLIDGRPERHSLERAGSTLGLHIRERLVPGDVGTSGSEG